MSLATGTRLGPYEITAQIGEGGMGEVYRATDTKLKRQVAIKVLPEAVANDAERLARFRREAEVLAALNQPNIAAIYGLEDSGDTHALVMELVEGPTLADRIAQGPVAADEALPIAKQIAVALEAAHEQGIIHRDLKPANIKVRADGTVKVLDFGLAKAMEPAGAVSGAASVSMSPTITTPAMTQMGIILGTAAYMSPEQARGRAVDKRADIWAFGVLLFEMLTGTRAFEGEDVSLTLAAVLRAEVNLDVLPAETPARVRQALAACLERDLSRRVRDIGDVRLALEGVFETPVTLAPETVAAPPGRRLALPFLTLAAGVLLTAAAAWSLWPATAPADVDRFVHLLPAEQRFRGTGRPYVALSPDGRQFVYNAVDGLYLRTMDEVVAQPITESNGLTNPFFSADGQWVGYWQDSQLKRIAISGGAAVTIGPATNPFGASWETDGTILFGQPAGILRVPATGGTPQVVIPVEAQERVYGPQLLPDGDTVLFTHTTAEWDEAAIVVQSIETGERAVVIERGQAARYVPTGHLVYAVDGVLMAVPFDPGTRRVTPGAVPLVAGVASTATTGAVQFSVSRTGSLVYVPGAFGSGASALTLATLDLQGGLERLALPPNAYAFPRVSPDGTRVAMSTEEDANVWIYDLTGTTAPRQLTLGSANRYPVWAADGERVAFQSDREGDLGIFWQKVDGSEPAERLTTPEDGIAHIPDSWSPDGSILSYTAIKGADGALWLLSVPDKTATVFAEHAGSLIGRSDFSPDGRWLAYQSTETGTNQIFVQPVPGTGAKYPVVNGGHPLWSPDGREILYNAGPAQLGIVRVTLRPTFSFGEPTRLPLAGLSSRNPNGSPTPWDVTHDGQRILGVTPAEAAGGTSFAPQIQIVLNWFEELKRLVSTGN